MDQPLKPPPNDDLNDVDEYDKYRQRAEVGKMLELSF